MAKTAAQIEVGLKEIEKKLDETLDSMFGQRSPIADSIRVIVPMMQDQVKILRDVVDLLKE